MKKTLAMVLALLMFFTSVPTAVLAEVPQPCSEPCVLTEAHQHSADNALLRAEQCYSCGGNLREYTSLVNRGYSLQECPYDSTKQDRLYYYQYQTYYECDSCGLVDIIDQWYEYELICGHQ